MAYDLLKGEQVPGDWSLGTDDSSEGWIDEKLKSLVGSVPWKTVGLVAGGLVGLWLLLPFFSASKDAPVPRPRVDDEFDALLKPTAKLPDERMEEIVHGKKR